MPDIQLTRREQYLAQLPVYGVPVKIRFVEHVVSTKRLLLGDRVVKWMPIPQPHVIEQRLVYRRIDGNRRPCFEFHLFDALFQTVSGTCGVNVCFDIRPFERDFIRLHIQTGNQFRNDKLNRDRQNHNARQDPTARSHQSRGRNRRSNQKPLQRQCDVGINVIDASHKPMFVVHHLITAEIELDRERKQHDRERTAQEAGFQAA